MPRLRVRHIAVCASIVVWIYYFLPHDEPFSYVSYYCHRTSHVSTAILARYMNDLTYIPHFVATPSSFDWSSVPFSYPLARTPTLPAPVIHRPRIQHRFRRDAPRLAAIQEQRQLEVKKVFEKSWTSYKNQAWLKDALKPISGGYVDQFSGWAATLVDSLDTLWMMGMRDKFYEVVEAVATIDFGKSTALTVNSFETCIRYLGGLLAAYDLSGHEVLKFKAIEVGDLLYAGFNTEEHMPVDFINFEDAKLGLGLTVETQVVSASPGTITLEFSRLSQITGDNKYYAAVSQVMDVFYEGQNKTELSGIIPMCVYMNSKNVSTGFFFTLGGDADSLYDSKKYGEMSQKFMDTALNNLLFSLMIPGKEDIFIAGNVDVTPDGLQLLPNSEYLSCFIGGVYAFGGRLFDNDNYLDIGAKVARGCAYAYKSFPTGIMPEQYSMVPCPGPDHRNRCAWDEELFASEAAKHHQSRPNIPKGFTAVKDSRYLLRPEAIESVFVLWRITGDPMWRETAWEMFKAVVNATETTYANAAIIDVTVIDSEKEDYMESFWLAETLKYFYLCFADAEFISLDDFVLNTEAHPLRLSKR